MHEIHEMYALNFNYMYITSLWKSIVSAKTRIGVKSIQIDRLALKKMSFDYKNSANKWM